MTDWGSGSYELTAQQLAPVASVVADAVEPVAELRTLDIACGTGNATLLAAARGANATGLDSAPRLLEVAAGRAAEEGLDATWVEGSMLDLPFSDDSFDVITSVFGVIFGDPPHAVAAEIARVLHKNGRIALTTWTDEGVLPRIAELTKAAFQEAFDLPPEEEKMFAWGDGTDLRGLFADHGIALQVEKRHLVFTSESAEATAAEWSEYHPMWLAARSGLGEERFAALREKVVAELDAANEAGQGLQFSSNYLLALGSPV